MLQFQLFGQALLITGGGPNNRSRPIVQFIYEAGFRDLQLGFAAAASQVLFALMLLAALGADVARRGGASAEHGEAGAADGRWATGCCWRPWCCWRSSGSRRSSGWSGCRSSRTRC